MTRAILLCLTLALATPACTGAQHRTATVAIVTAGGAVAALHSAHQDAYRRATDALLARGLRDADYDAAVAPLDAAFARRSEAIQTLASAVYGAGAVADAAKERGGAAYVVAARALLDALRRGVATLREGSALPPVAIPADVTRVMDQLAAIAGGA